MKFIFTEYNEDALDDWLCATDRRMSKLRANKVTTEIRRHSLDS